MDLQKFLDIIKRKASEIYVDLTDPKVAKAMFDDLKRWLPTLGINVSYDFTPARTTFICSPKISGTKINPIENFANGLVFCIEDQQVRLLCVPAKDCKRIHNINELPFKKEDYVMYYVVDGMSFTLYCDGGCWKYGTQHSADIYDMHYRGVEYKDVFAEKLKLDFDTLDRSNCYHFRMKHRSLHPHNENTEFIYHLSTFNLTKMDFVECDIGIPKQRPGTAITGKGFGYIFRAKSKDAPDYKYETKKRLEITSMLYKPPFIKERAERNKFMVYYTKRNFYILHNYLNPTMRTKFIRAFPQFEDEYRRYDTFLEDVASLFFGIKGEDNCVRQFYLNVKDDILPVYQPKNKQDLIKNFLHNPKYAYAIYECVYQ